MKPARGLLPALLLGLSILIFHSCATASAALPADYRPAAKSEMTVTQIQRPAQAQTLSPAPVATPQPQPAAPAAAPAAGAEPAPVWQQPSRPTVTATTTTTTTISRQLPVTTTTVAEAEPPREDAAPAAEAALTVPSSAEPEGDEAQPRVEPLALSTPEATRTGIDPSLEQTGLTREISLAVAKARLESEVRTAKEMARLESAARAAAEPPPVIPDIPAPPPEPDIPPPAASPITPLTIAEPPGIFILPAAVIAPVPELLALTREAPSAQAQVPEPLPEPLPEPVPEPEPEPVQVALAAPEPTPELIPDSIPLPEPEQAAEPEPAAPPVQEIVPVQELVQELAPEPTFAGTPSLPEPAETTAHGYEPADVGVIAAVEEERPATPDEAEVPEVPQAPAAATVLKPPLLDFAADLARNRMEWALENNAVHNYPALLSKGRMEMDKARAALDAGDYSLATELFETAYRTLLDIQQCAPLPSMYTVKSDETLSDSLWRIAARDFVYADGKKWIVLYEANRNNLVKPGNPDLILPGQVIRIPSLWGEYREGAWDPLKTYIPFGK